MSTPPSDPSGSNTYFNRPADGYPPAPGYTPAPPGPAPRRRRRGRWIGRLLVPAIILLAAGGYYLYQKQTATENAQVGDCIQVESASLTDAKTSQIDCGDPKAIYVVTQTGGGVLQCDDGESQVTLGDATTRAVDTKVCLRENVKVGDCWNEGEGATSVPIKAVCSALSNTTGFLKVLAVDLTTANIKKCPKGTDQTYAYPKRKVLICFGTP